MKIRYWIIGYTTIMFLVLGYLLSSFQNQTVSGRDMVYYNEQYILISDALNQGIEREQIEKEYGCRIILAGDKKYEIQLQESLKNEAFILDYLVDGDLAGKIIWEDAWNQYEQLKTQLFERMLLFTIVLLVGGNLFFIFVHIRLFRPFHKLQIFSGQVARGNLDFPLPATKHPYFGTFTESFDLMREELKKARENEYQANKSKKELMAQLSHDIKTPVATIQAACEVIQMKEKNQDTIEKVRVIDGKAKTIHSLVNNLFQATLEELTVLKVEATEESSLCIKEMFADLEYYGELKQTGELPECLVYMDKLRLQQVIDNCLNNAWKYANTSVEVAFKELENGIQIQIKDNGSGVSEEELPLILEKFYRGNNAKGKEGSGLGLYLANTFMKQMKGGMECYNDNGFVVQLFLRKVS